MKKISTIVISYNAETTIERCLGSAAQISDQIVVVDSFSTDKTVDLARKYTNDVYTHEWCGYAQQKKIALERTSNQWVLWIDSDEELSEALIKEIRAIDFSFDGYCIPRQIYYLNKWIKHCGWYPDYVLRLFKKDRGTFNNEIIHESVSLCGSTAYLKSPLYHYSYRNIAHHLEKMNQFTSLAAQKMYSQNKSVTIVSLLSHTLGHFFKTFFLKKGFMDGMEGVIVCILSAYYVFLKYAKLWELQKK